MNDLHVLIFFFFVRLASVFLVQTWYVPDEYWQSLEVAHRLAFGYGYLTWEWDYGIRSYVYPLLIALLYKGLAVFNADYVTLLIYLPRILEATLSAFSDLCFYKWSGTRKWAVFVLSTSWFWFYSASRTLINTFETSLTVIALQQFPWAAKSHESKLWLWIVGLLCLIRPTAAIHWFPLCIYHIILSRDQLLKVLIKQYLFIGFVELLLTTTADSYYHGSFVVTSYEFLKLNIFEGVGEWYGSLPWHWYLSQGFPAVVGIHLISFVLATIHILKNRYIFKNELTLLGCIVFTITVYSVLPHKEFRFIMPLLPITLYISTGYLSRWSHKASNIIVWLVAGIIIVGNAIPAFYCSLIHQRGTLDVMGPLREIAVENPSNTSILFLMPCHSTPLYSHLHVNVTTRFLSCKPNFKNDPQYVDEADHFYNNPAIWLRQQYLPNQSLPSHIVTFDQLVFRLSDVLSRYKPIYRIFHTHIPTGRVGRYVIIHERIDFSFK